MEQENSSTYKPEQELVSRITLGIQLQGTERFVEAIDNFLKASSLAATLGVINLQEVALRNLGKCYLALKDYEKAYSSLSEALVLAVKLEDVDNQCILLERLGTCMMHQEKPAVAQQYFEQLFGIAQKKEDPDTLATTSYNLGLVHMKVGQYRKALDCFRLARAYFIMLQATDAAAYCSNNIVWAANAIGEEFIGYVSFSIAEQLICTTPVSAQHQLQQQSYGSDTKQDVFCALLTISSNVFEVESFLTNSGFYEGLRISEANLLQLVGDMTRQITRTSINDPCHLFEAARYIVQLKRGMRATALLEQVRKGELAPDISCTGSGPFLLYLRSFVAASKLPKRKLERWGTVDLEEILTCRLDQGPWPLIALGNPEIQAFGAGKIQTDDLAWQADLTELGKHANYIFLVPCVTEGTCWEMEWVVIHQLLRKTVFIMPPSVGEDQKWWMEKWKGVQRWSRYLGLAFPDYSPEGLFFALSPEGHLASVDYDTLLLSEDPLHLTLLSVLGQFIPSTEWLTPVIDNLQYVFYKEDAEKRNIPVHDIIQERVEEHVQRINKRIMQIRPDVAATISPYLLGMLEGGIEGLFSNWPPKSRRIPQSPGVYTIWEANKLLWAGATDNIFTTLDLHAEGKLEQDAFSKALYEQLIYPYLKNDVKIDIENRMLPKDKIVRFYIRRNLRYRFIPMKDTNEAQLYSDIIKQGALNAGSPQLNVVKENDIHQL